LNDQFIDNKLFMILAIQKLIFSDVENLFCEILL